MAYNREWDRGKETWNEQASWSQADGRSNIRGREDDYYGDTKRRKFNSGAYHGYDNYNEGAHSGASTQDQSQDNSQDRFQQRGGANTKKRLIPSEPSPHVIFLGLDPDFTESDLQAFLSSHRCSIETVTIIRERSSGSSKGFGFAQFSSTEHARAFVDPLFPFIQVPPPASHGASAIAAFYKALETGIPHNGRRVKIDYSQSASPHEKGRSTRGNTNDGTRDIGNSPGPVLLFRGLDELSGPQAILQAMKSSLGSGRDGAKGMRRIILIKDKVTLASFCFAFVEFVNIEFASAVLAATMSSQVHPSGFRISDKPVATSFAHPDSFQPIVDVMLRDEACITSSSSLGGVEGGWVRYWDESSTIAVLEFQVETPQPATASGKEKKDKKKKDATRSNLPPSASVLPVSDKPVTLSLTKGFNKPQAGPVKSSVLGFSEENGEDDPESAGTLSSKGRMVAPLIKSKKTASNITKWNQVQEVLSSSIPSSSITGAVPKDAAEAAKREDVQREVPSNEEEFEFSDVDSMSCLLCARQFKSVEQLRRHNKESDLHRKNSNDVNMREIARQKVASRKSSASDGQIEQVKYRDRASERRTLFNQPDVPLPEGDALKPQKERHVDHPQAPLPPTPSIQPAKDENNVGNKLLKMMGWTEGTGLGSSGDGRVDPIKTSIYAEGAGLGASKGKEIEKYAEGFSNYAAMVQDSARDRFSSTIIE